MARHKRYGVMRTDGKLFAYSSGHFDFVSVSDIHLAYLTDNLLNIHVAAQQAVKEGHVVEPVAVVFELFPVDIDEYNNRINEAIRERALAKLTPEERAVLGLSIR